MGKRKPRIIIDPVGVGFIPFSLSQSLKFRPEYACSECRAVFMNICDAQFHMYDKHPAPKKEKKPRIAKAPPREKLRKPDSRERRDIRRAIAEAKQRKLIP